MRSSRRGEGGRGRRKLATIIVSAGPLLKWVAPDRSFLDGHGDQAGECPACLRLTTLEPSQPFAADSRDSGGQRLRDLEELSLYNTSITDAGLVHLAGLTRLKKLCLAETNVSDAGLAHLAALKHLQLLLVQQTAVTETGAARLRLALPECEVVR